ncbi:MAG: hypothetical protein KFH87_10010 [Bacteroidetes bacterium]|nr:hypothetical protein [Bacteroidota bacterium]
MSQEPFMEILGIFDDEGNRYEPTAIPKPPLCVLCREDVHDHPFEEVLCHLTRLDFMLQEGDDAFSCHAFEPRD